MAALPTRSWARAFPPHPASMSLRLGVRTAAGGLSVLEPGSEGSPPLGLVPGSCSVAALPARLCRLPRRVGLRLQSTCCERCSDSCAGEGERGESACRGVIAPVSCCAPSSAMGAEILLIHSSGGLCPSPTRVSEQQSLWMWVPRRGAGLGCGFWGSCGVRGRSSRGAGGSCWLLGRLVRTFISGNQLGACKRFPLWGVQIAALSALQHLCLAVK